jgi:hypothetical protein
MSRLVIALIGVALTPLTFGAERPRASLGGVSLGDSRAAVEAKLGEPPRREKTGDVVDPQYHYAGLVVGFLAEGDRSVAHVRSTSTTYCSDTGVCPGMSTARATAVLNAAYGRVQLVNGDNQINVQIDTCWLNIHVARGRVEWLALNCQV